METTNLIGNGSLYVAIQGGGDIEEIRGRQGGSRGGGTSK
jgi:hypothetical protein